jgi:SAM-dependent methyltransferase
MRSVAARALSTAASGAVRASQRIASDGSGPGLQGDRAVEWSFCMARLTDGPGTTLDFGAGVGPLSLCAAQRGHEVIALDRVPLTLDYAHEAITLVQADILDRPLEGSRFDQIINCSSVEHVGLAGRYGSFAAAEGDLEAMEIMRSMLVSGGKMILTIPVGRDMVCAPRHRIYGRTRLPRLLDSYERIEEQYWCKNPRRGWVQTDPGTAFATEGSESFYSLGLFVLAPSVHKSSDERQFAGPRRLATTTSSTFDAPCRSRLFRSGPCAVGPSDASPQLL